MRKGIGIAVGAVVLGLCAATTVVADSVKLEITDETGNVMSGDPQHGESVFHRCQVCHSIKPGENHIGPSLHGVVGRTAGTVAGFNYSTANKSSGIVWTEQKIFTYLKNPQATVPGTKMAFPGLASAQDRADVISYLKQNSP
jgi:cytochrome c